MIDCSSKFLRAVDDNLCLQFLTMVSSIIKDNYELKDTLEIIKYYGVFTSKNVSDFLLNNGFEFDKVSFLNDSKMLDKLDIDSDDYIDVKNVQILNSLEDLTCSLLDVFEFGDKSLYAF